MKRTIALTIPIAGTGLSDTHYMDINISNFAPPCITGFTPFTPHIFYPQNSYTDPVHSAEDGGFYQINVQLQP